MKKYQRALSAAVTVAVVGAGVTTGAGTAEAADHQTSAASAARSSSTNGLLDGPLLTVTSLPVLSGIPAVGSTLSMTQPVWNLLNVTNSVQWFADGVAIPGATGWSFIPGAEQAGSTIQGVVTGSLLGLLPVQTVSNLIQLPGTGGSIDPSNPLAALQLPGLSGTPSIGSLLQILDPVWSLPGVSTAYQWFVDNVPVAGATDPTYIPVLGDAGKQIYATVTGTLAGVPVVSLITSKLAIPTTTAKEMQAGSAPSVSSIAQVGKALTATNPTWNTDGVTNSYQWFRDSAAISGATAQTYTPTADDLGRSVSVKVTGKKDGYTDATAASNAATVQLGDAPTYSTQPTVTGVHRAGETLTAAPGSWGSGSTPTYTYQWKRDGSAIAGATTSTYAVATSDVGHALNVTVTATRTGYRPGSFTTSSVSVDKLASTTSAKLKKAKIPATKKATLTMKVTSAGSAPTGTFAVYDGRTLVKRYAATSSVKTVVLPKLKAGVHQLRAVFLGTDSVAASVSGVAKLVVTKVKKKH